MLYAMTEKKMCICLIIRYFCLSEKHLIATDFPLNDVESRQEASCFDQKSDEGKRIAKEGWNYNLRENGRQGKRTPINKGKHIIDKTRRILNCTETCDQKFCDVYLQGA